MSDAQNREESGVSTSSPDETDYTKALRGANNVYDFALGNDGVLGTRDDIRGDDVNVNYFRTSGTADEQNNPFTLDAIVD